MKTKQEQKLKTLDGQFDYRPAVVDGAKRPGASGRTNQFPQRPNRDGAAKSAVTGAAADVGE